jgi:class 3 adenylate cyclase/tetratricopeptide (TPR) repeat protein
MNCGACGTENRDSARFCDSCGAPLEARCPGCGAIARVGARFCDACGAGLGSAAVSAPTPLRTPVRSAADRVAPKASEEPVQQGERKTVTALFADIKGSTELEQDLDPEEARAIVDPALKLMIDAVQRYDGYLVQSTGDGIFAIFGAPVAHEDHPQRALYAALRMQDELRRYSDRLLGDGRAPLEIRVGANTGEVVVRSISTGGGKSEYTPIGHTANLASRMQAIAPTGSIAISEPTRKLVEGYFALKPRGPTRVKGIAEPVNVYEVTGLGPLRTRLQRSAGRGLTKFVGREREMSAMNAAAERAQSGHGQIVAAMAEAGTGKSRLFFEFKAKNQSGWMVLEAFSVSHGKASAYLPVLDLLHTYFKIISDDDSRTRRAKVTGNVLTLDKSLEDTLPYLFALLGIVEGEDPLARMDAQVKKRRTLDAIKRILLRESLNQPLIVMFEDLHWIDEQTQEFLNLLVDSIANAKILLLVNYRPQYSHQWGSRTYYTQLRLDPLGKESADEMLAALLGDNPELAALQRTIIERTEGNPFFMEETVQVLLDEGALVRDGATLRLTKPIGELKIPPTVQGILAARIDRLPAGTKELLQTLAVIGREFPISLVRAVASKAEDDLERMLSDLQLGEFIYEQPAVGDSEYAFKHALTQEVAYNSVLMERRKLLHQRAAEGIEGLFAGQLEDHLDELARHYARSPNNARAVRYLHLAGEQAARLLAYKEAIGHFTQGLVLLRTLPDDSERAQRELNIQLSLADSLRWTVGMGSEEALRALLRARELCEQMGETGKLFEVLHGLQAHHAQKATQGASFAASREGAQVLLSLAERANEPAKLMVAHGALGLSLLMDGDFLSARDHLEQASPSLDWRQTPYFGIFYPCFGAWSLWVLGHVEQAIKWSDAVLDSAEGLSQPASLANALALTTQLHMFLRDPGMTQKRADAAIAIASEYGIAFDLAYGTFARGWALAEQGHPDQGLADMRSAVAALKATGFGMRPRWAAYLAQPCARSMGPDEGLRLLAEGFALVSTSGYRWFEAELHRLKGELLLMREAGDTVEPERCFRTAIEISRRGSARSWELRAATSLARLLRDTKRRDEGRAILAEIYDWFTEGFDTADLKDARALLDELGN